MTCLKGTLLFKLIPRRATAQANELPAQLDRQSSPEASYSLHIIRNGPKVSVFISASHNSAAAG